MSFPKTILALFLILCLYLAMTLKNNKVFVKANPSTLNVPYSYPTIQEAINNANAGDIIFVSKGIYKESVVINKSITLIGENRENTIIDGKAAENVISIRASSVKISGFTIKNSSPVIGCGIFIERSEDVIICNNNVVNNGIGIQITFCSKSQIYENAISANYMGIQIFYSSSNNAIYRNAIFNNDFGIYIFYYSIGNLFYENEIYGNTWGVYLSLYCNNNVFYHNNFVDNVEYNVYAEQTANTWCYGGEGNYWDDYEGEDLDKDGIGDTPYVITGKNKDYCPLMGRYYTFAVPFKGENYRVSIVSNSTISNFTFQFAAELRTKIILFNASSTNGTAGFSRVVIPKGLMGNVHAVLVNEEEVNATLINAIDVKNAYLYIEHSGNCSIKIVYLELLDLYYQLLDRIRSLNDTNNMLVEKINALNETLHNLLMDWSDFQKLFLNLNASYQDQAQNLKYLAYVFAAATAIFIMITIYLSKVAHSKHGGIVES